MAAFFGQPQQSADSSFNDINVDNPNSQPNDAVSCLAWATNPQLRLLAAGLWNGKLMVYEVVLLSMQQKYLTLKTSIEHTDPILSVAWNTDSSIIFFGGADGSVKALSIGNQQVSNIGMHQGPTRHVFWVSQMNVLVSVSFDCSIKFWQPGNPNPVATLTSDSKIYVADLVYPVLALSFEKEKIMIIDLPSIQTIPNMKLTNPTDNPLGSQIISMALSQNLSHIGFGSCDGRGNLSKLYKNPNFTYRIENVMTFKAHKTGEAQSQILFPVNAIGFNPRGSNYVFTAGGESKMYFWDFLNKQKITEFSFQNTPVTASVTSPDGNLLAYALGYDWQKGVWGLDVQYQNKICVKMIQDTDLVYIKK